MRFGSAPIQFRREKPSGWHNQTGQPSPANVNYSWSPCGDALFSKTCDALGEWLRKLIVRCGVMKATVALANKLVRIIWRILKDDVDFMMKKAVN